MLLSMPLKRGPIFTVSLLFMTFRRDQLTPEQFDVIHKLKIEFEHHGVHLPPTERDRVVELSDLIQQYSSEVPPLPFFFLLPLIFSILSFSTMMKLFPQSSFLSPSFRKLTMTALAQLFLAG